MHDTLSVQRVDPAEHPKADGNRLRHSKSAARDPRGERLSLQQLHRQVELAVIFANFIELADGRMIDRRGGARFARQPLPRDRIGGGGSQGLDGQGTAELRIPGRIHDAHAPFAERARDLVATDASQLLTPNY